MMHRSPRNPTRRSRNIGTAKQGHGQDNRLVIPDPAKRREMYWANLENPVAIEGTVHGRTLTILVEPTRPGFQYPCTVEDVYELLTLAPPDDIRDLAMVILRQPTRKQRILCSVWGRFLYRVERGKYEGPAVCLEAQRSLSTWHWGDSLTPDSRLELDRLHADGHRSVKTARGYRFSSDPIAMRSTVLFRTLPHEIGHLVDWKRSVAAPPSASDDDVDYLERQFDSRPSQMKEACAHRYAAELLTKLRASGSAPFPSRGSGESARLWGLLPEWFMNIAEGPSGDIEREGRSS